MSVYKSVRYNPHATIHMINDIEVVIDLILLEASNYQVNYVTKAMQHNAKHIISLTPDPAQL